VKRKDLIRSVKGPNMFQPVWPNDPQ
jgi:hypothetical protein